MATLSGSLYAQNNENHIEASFGLTYFTPIFSLNQEFSFIHNSGFEIEYTFTETIEYGIPSVLIVGLGLGYEFNLDDGNYLSLNLHTIPAVGFYVGPKLSYKHFWDDIGIKADFAYLAGIPSDWGGQLILGVSVVMKI
jgi:hypothetical protein